MYKIAAIVTVLTLLLGCQDNTQPQSQTDVIRPVKLVTVANSEQSDIRSFPAEVVANQGSYLAFRVNGELMEFPVLAGQEVTQGQLLAKLDPEDFELQLEQRKAQYELASSQLARVESLFNKSIASKAEYDQALANKQVAESALKIAKTNLQNSELRAPFSGTIAKVFVKNYENVVAKQNILRLETRDMMDVVIQVPEKLVARVDKDLDYHPRVVFDGYPDKSYELSIKEWDTQADPATLSYKVVFTLPIPKDFNLLAGMTGHVYIDRSKVMHTAKKKLYVPISAVFSERTQPLDDNAFVWVFDEQTQTLSKRAISVGKMHDQSIEITAGLNGGEIIVGAGVHHLEEGLKVRPWTKERGL
ncbi:efflux RND transporter periplasmic adaptor subunit [Pseudoalteromonas sp. S16_S37]|uniref:efflux RND transporter periplasmic adaptor subunit n=1 Tax=Pseudoalteromonas sp. S16_S37 TaxID=2720228 RepID=UPI0016813716|nr:efflux RND transporter periplasmic adaptor subunit [Pseudoalteromonas sp. S16_S37]MBD1584041.1 efflux RND transporter periplasmic adaptor subunit [Pseudoalteromonas sp. S16_S37]